MITSNIVFALCIPLLAQRVIGTGSTVQGNIVLTYETRVEPGSPDTPNLGVGSIVDDKGIHRYIDDRRNRTYVGYDIEVRQESGGYVIHFRAFSVPVGRLELPEAGGPWTMLSLPAMPAAQVVRAGDTIALDLLVNPSTGQKVVDYIKVQNGPLVVTHPARNDSSTLNMLRPEVFIDGAPTGAATFSQLIGSVGWVYIAGQGRFIYTLSNQERLGFQRAGDVTGNLMRFSIGGKNVMIKCDGEITPGKSTYNVYVLHQHSWKPSGSSEKFTFGMADTAESLVHD